MRELASAKEGSSIKRLLSFLLAQTTLLILENCHLCSDGDFAAFLALDDAQALTRKLTSVRMQHFTPCRSTREARRHWSEILRMLSGYAGLKCFSMEELHNLGHWNLFHLPHTTEKHEISGEDVAEQLRALATLVGAEPEREDLDSDNSSSDEEDE